MEAVRVQRAPHVRPRALDDGDRAIPIGGFGRPMRDLVEHLGATLASHTDEKAVLAVEELREREVVGALGGWAGAHRRAEAGRSRIAAVDGDDEDSFPTGGVVAIDVAAAHEDTVLNCDRAEVAAANAEERVTLGRRILFDLQALAVPLRAPDPHPGWQQVLLPGVRPGGEAKPRFVFSPHEPVRAGLLHICPAGRQIRRRLELLVDDRPVAQLRPDDLEITPSERRDELLQPCKGDDVLGCVFSVHSCPNGRRHRPLGLPGNARCSCGFPAESSRSQHSRRPSLRKVRTQFPSHP